VRLDDERSEFFLCLVGLDLEALGEICFEREPDRFVRLELPLEIVAVHVHLERGVSEDPEHDPVVLGDGDVRGLHNPFANPEVELARLRSCRRRVRA
jgi:hypothetical protein